MTEVIIAESIPSAPEPSNPTINDCSWSGYPRSATKWIQNSPGKTPAQYLEALHTAFDHPATCFTFIDTGAAGEFKIESIPREYLSITIGGCDVINNPGGCAFNPILLDLDAPAKVPMLSSRGLAAVCLLLVAAAAFAVRRA
jgi:hypothetical protein